MNRAIIILAIMASFIVGVSFSSVYAGIPWDTSEIADNAITSKKIKNFQVKTHDIKGNAVKSLKIKDGTIKGVDIKDGTITSADIADGTITNADLPFSIKFKTILDDAAGNAAGWDPDGVAQFFLIDDDDVTENSFIIVGIGGGTFFFDDCGQTAIIHDASPSGNDFQMTSCPPVPNGAQLRYTIITP